MSALPGWSDDGLLLRKTYTLSGFSAASELIGRIAALADAADHHPDLHLTGYKKLEVVLTTHDAGGKVTERDRKLAAAIEALPKA